MSLFSCAMLLFVQQTRGTKKRVGINGSWWFEAASHSRAGRHKGVVCLRRPLDHKVHLILSSGAAAPQSGDSRCYRVRTTSYSPSLIHLVAFILNASSEAQ